MTFEYLLLIACIKAFRIVKVFARRTEVSSVLFLSLVIIHSIESLQMKLMAASDTFWFWVTKAALNSPFITLPWLFFSLSFLNHLWRDNIAPPLSLCISTINLLIVEWDALGTTSMVLFMCFLVYFGYLCIFTKIDCYLLCFFFLFLFLNNIFLLLIKKEGK